MKKRIYYILTILLCLTWGAATTYTHAQTTDGKIWAIYVSPAGSFDGNGQTWGTAKDNLQNAIDVLNEIPDVYNGVKRGYVFVAGTEDNGAAEINNLPKSEWSTSATYIPNRRSTDDADGSVGNTSFRIYPNIYVIGGFRGDEVVPTGNNPDTIYCKTLKELPNMRWLSSGKLYGEMIALHGTGTQGILDESRSWDLKYKSILSGNHHTNNYSFTFDQKRGVYNTTFPLSSYHVVWFGTAGVIDPSDMDKEGYTPYTPNIEGIDPVTKQKDYKDNRGDIYYRLDETTKTAIVTRGPTAYPGTSLVIPDTIMKGTGKSAVVYKVTEIRNGAFANCADLAAVTIGSNVKTIGQAAFYGCTSLASVSMSNVTEISRFAFYGCGALTTINHPGEEAPHSPVAGFPKSIEIIDRWAFANTGLPAATEVPPTISFIGRYAFRKTGINTSKLPVYEKEESSMTGRFKGLPYKSKVAGFTIEGGNASSTNLVGHDHTGFGGGVYMVRNSEIEDCIIHHCSAVQRGGAVYQDGGGDVNYCYIHTCQVTGFGMQQGYGGGVCIDYDGQVEHCYITQCAGRVGAGLAICHDPDEYPEETAPVADRTFYDKYKDNEQLEATSYSPFAKASLITNCTSNAEGAGVYLNYGGSLDHLTVVNNKCIGPDVIYYGMRHGRTGGIYVREAAAISNTVVWGNECAVNSDIQFAAFKSLDYYTISVDHSAFSKGDITDWSAVVRKAVVNLNDINYPSATFSTGNFAMFEHPTDRAGIMHSGGVVNPADTAAGSAYQDAYYWHPLGMSSMRGKGKQIVDVTIASRTELMHANATQDLLGIKFESVSVCGAITNSYHEVTYTLMRSLEHLEGRILCNDATCDEDDIPLLPTIVVDPSMVATDTLNRAGRVGFQEDQVLGANWTYPLNNLQDAVYYFSQYLVDPIDENNCTADDYVDDTKSYYDFGETDPVTNQPIHYPNVQILVKEGSMNVAGRGAYLTGHIRTAAVRPVSRMRLYGGYPSAQKDETKDDKLVPIIIGREPYKYKTEVRADVTGGDFNDHSVHVFSLANMHDIIIDGFRMIGGNGNIAKPDTTIKDSTYEAEMAFYNSVANGGGLAMNNSNETFPRDMTGNIVRNCVIANCAAPEGAGIFVNGNAEHGSEERKCIAELTVVNTIIRNCTAGDTWDNPNRYVANNVTPILDQITNEGVCTANGSGAKIIFRNCDIMNNCGFPFKCTPIDPIPVADGSVTYNGKLSRAIAETPGSDFTKIGKIEVYNSVTFSNGLRVHPDRSGINSTVFCPKESWYNVSGEYIYMGYDVMLPRDYIKVEGEGYADDDARYPDDELEERLNSKNIFRILTHVKDEDRKPLETRIVDGSQQGTGGGPEVTARYPYFVNPSRNVGHSTTDDKSFYGGAVNYEPLPTNPIVNAANVDAGKDTGTGIGNSSAKWAKYMGYDIALNTRDYGGDPDIGAIETKRLLKAGLVLYVTPDGAGKRDGSSWGNAIAGNTIYALNGAGPDEGHGDALDVANGTTRIINSDPTIGTGKEHGVTTSDKRYKGGFGRSWFTDINEGGRSVTTVTSTWTKEINVYDNGVREGDTIPVHEDTDPKITEDTDIKDPGSTIPDFVADYFDDDRYPYGEISGASRSFWRANPHKKTSAWTCDYTDMGTFITACNNEETGFIKNNRRENFVSGLQYAVEKAAAYNALPVADRIAGIDSVQVWVSNGVYTDYKGFVMRDKTTVMGGFPAKDGGTPGLDERQALMSSVIDIPKSLSAKDLNPADYETILQISDIDPRQDNETLNTSAVNYWDDDWVKVSSVDTIKYEYKTRTITHHYKALPSGSPVPLTDTYVQYSDMNSGSANVWASPTSTTVVDGIRYYTFGTATQNKDCWHLSVPDDNYNRRIQEFGETAQTIYEGGSALSEKPGNDAHLRNGTLTGVNVWQTLKNIPAGNYFITIDLAAFYYDQYKNVNGNTGNSNVNVKLQVVDSTSNVLIEERSIYFYKGRPNLNRYKVDFTLDQPSNVSVKLIVGPGLDKKGNEVADDYTLPVVDYNANFKNRREINIDNLRLYEVVLGNDYEEDKNAKTDVLSNRDVVNPLPPETIPNMAYQVTEGAGHHRTSLRKRVLTMPDVCVPTYGAGRVGADPATNAGGPFADNLSHTDRVTGATKDKRTSSTLKKYEDPNYVEYSKVYWDGFTIRHGFIYDERMAHGGGAGVNMYEGAHLRNCIVINNMSSCPGVKGAGMFCDGATSTIEGCFVLNNTSTYGTLTIIDGSVEQKQIFAGGMFMYEGTCFNSLFAKNYSYGSAGGLGFCVGRFFNNTIAYNTCLMEQGGAISLATSSKPNLFVANTIIYGNSGVAIRDRGDESGGSTWESVNPFLHCYIQSAVAQPNAPTIQNVTNYDPTEDAGKTKDKRNYGIGNVFLNGPEHGGTPSADNTPFAADLNINGEYIGAENHNDFRLLDDLPDCINSGTEAFAGTLYDALRYKDKSKADIEALVVYQNVLNTKLPDKDVVFADRVQDCRIDMGAYEFDGTRSIEPTLFPEDKKAIFFVTKEGGGFASAKSPSDAACSEKFQKVLDAAGRWRFGSYYLFDEDSKTQELNNFDINRFREELKDAGVAADVSDPAISEELKNLKDYEVIVRLEGNYNYDGSSEWKPFSYVPTRSVNPNSGNENVLMYSLMVPHGIRVEGGYEKTFDTIAKPRDILGRPTYLDGTVSESGGKAYHVITFTNDLFTIEEELFGQDGDVYHNQLEFLSDTAKYCPEGTDFNTLTKEEKAPFKAKTENSRVVMDGVFLQNGNASGTDEDYQKGGAAIVTDYAHIRNCVIRRNNASSYGGGLYLNSRALVSGCIIKENTADYGAGIYVFEPDAEAGNSSSPETYAHIVSSTIANNTATVSAGGLFFATNVRANSVAIWHNTANANPNVAGTDATGQTQLVENYPMNYCGVESRRMAGVNNIELPEAAEKGVRWNSSTYYETSPEEGEISGQIYFPITMASVLTRTGMPYTSYLEMRAKYPTLDTVDIFGLNRMKQDLETYIDPVDSKQKTRPYKIILADGTTKVDKEEKNNNFIEIGARVLNADFQVKLEFTHVMKRLFVTTTERLPTTKAVALQENTESEETIRRYTSKSITPTDEQRQRTKDDVAMYKQMGSCFLNPMLRVGDALDYIIRVRKAVDETYEKDKRRITLQGDTIWMDTVADETRYSFKSVAEVFKDERFEIFICGGTYYPYKDAYGVQGESRANTFVIPEKVTVVGGVNHDGGVPDGSLLHPYCQEGYYEDVVRTEDMEIAGYPLERATTLEIRTVREHQDRNGNNVNEPWEMEEQTIFSGAAVQNDAKANVYHVITCLANPERVGQLPTRIGTVEGVKNQIMPPLFVGIDPSTHDLLTNIENENSDSRDERIIIIDGVTITGGYANKIDVSDEKANAQTLTYFRGGGILVEGNWDASFDKNSDLPEVLGVAKRDIPLILTACLIKDNTAGNGGGVYTNGTIYNFGCHYTQNLAIGPVEEEDTKYIPWSAGGAIATNYQCHMWNTLFDNNEARASIHHIIDGDGVMRTVEEVDEETGETITTPIKNPITNADERQGYGGVISSSETSLVRACNCDFVRNKAVAFPAIYNFIDNNIRGQASIGATITDKMIEDATEEERPKLLLQQNMYQKFGKGWHFAVNSIFWGNEASGDTVASATPLEHDYYKLIYDNDEKWNVHEEDEEGNVIKIGDIREPIHVANFAPHLDVATLTFCSYQEKTGRDGTVWWSNQDKAKAAPLKPKTYPDIGELDGLTRLYAGMFTDVLDEYFGYYKDGMPEEPYYSEEIIGTGLDAVTNHIPSALDNADLKYKGAYVYNTHDGGTVDYSTISGITDDNVRYSTAMTTLQAVAYNYNLVLSKENTETGGPFFVLPSLTAGVDGYMETANWLVSRLNNTIDTGWGFLKQNVKQTDETSGLYDTKLLKIDENAAGDTIRDKDGNDILVPIGYYLYTKEVPTGEGDETITVPDSVGDNFKRVKTLKGSDSPIGDPYVYGDPDTVLIPLDKQLDLGGKTIGADGTYVWKKVSSYNQTEEGEVYTYTIYRKSWNLADRTIHSDARLEEQYHYLFGEGFYNIHSKNIHLRFHDIGYPNLLPIGDDTYMTYVHEGENESMNMRRISTHPKMGVQDVFIDMGIYEYQYVQLITSGDEVDVIWVGPKEKGKGDGSSCRNATSNLQEAIESLLRSRNDHDKMIKLIGDPNDSYCPQITVNSKNKAFFIEVPSRTDGINLPKTLTADDTHSVKSLTIRGGYPPDITDLDDGESRRDIEANPVVFEMRKETGNSDQSLAHLFIIEDAGEKGCYMNYLTNKNKDFKDNVMPIVLDGITFCNPFGEDVDEGGAAIYYKPQYRIKETNGNYDREDPPHLLQAATYAIGTDTFAIPKLIIKNCVVMASGANKKVSAVKIEKGGGQSLIVNSVFHSNSGNPLEAVNTKIVNCTFALNGGHIKLVDETEKYYSTTDNPVKPRAYPSGLYNSIIWRDDQANGETDQIERWEDRDLSDNEDLVEKLAMPMKYNAITKKDTDPTRKDDLYIDNDDPEVNIIDNAWLHRTNRNVFLGPNFVDPKETFAEGVSYDDSIAQIVTRNFHINPSARFINKADTTTYLSIVPFYAEQSLQKQITVKISKDSEGDDDDDDDDDGDSDPDPDPEPESETKTYIFQSVQRLDRPKYVVDAEKNAHWYYPEPLKRFNLMGTETVDSFPTQAKEELYPFRRTTATVEEWDGDDITITSTPTNKRVTYEEHDLPLAEKKFRYDGAGMELGAYECSAALQRVLYVRSDGSGKKDGSSWSDAFGIGEFQNAIDVASIYSTIQDGGERAYVFASTGLYNAGTVKIRDGVSVFGGVPTGFNVVARREDDGTYTNSQINEYINKVSDVRSMVHTTAVSTIIGLESDENATAPNLGFMLEGFVLSAGETKKTPFNLDKHLTVIKNCVITGNEVSGGKPVVKMDNGLLYNSFVFGNTVTSGTPVVQVNADTHQAGVLNCTVIADRAGEMAITAAAEGSVVNTITFNEAEKTAVANALSRSGVSGAFVSCNIDTVNMFAPYFRAGRNEYELPDEFTNRRPLHYQLVETSSYINGGQDTTTTMGTTDNPTIFTPYAEFINYADIPSVVGVGDVEVGLAGDRDLLGNPRLLGYAPDVGCFETWKVDNSYMVTNQTDNHYVDNYGGHKYPHEGSVVYVMSNGSLVVDTKEGAATFTGDSTLSPGYVLVKEGGSIYGQGNTLEFSYVSAEKSFANGNKYGLVSMPFDYNLEATSAPATFKAYAYNAEERSAYNYVFKSEDSNLWEEDLSAIQYTKTMQYDEEEKDVLMLKRTEGWLLEFDRELTTDDNKIVRFTGFGATPTDYVYEEGSADKTVRLYQNDKRKAGSGSGLEFTRQEDMGWNLKGIPYLVSGYKTGDPNTSDAIEEYNMSIPHVYYKMGGDGEYIRKGAGIIYTEQSWAAAASLSMNEAFFTQTAAIGTYDSEAKEYKNLYEDLLFKHPMYSGPAPAYAMARPLVWVRDQDGNGDLLTVDPNPDAPKDVNYFFGRDGVKWMTKDAPQLYLLTSSKSRLSLLGAAPTETDLPLGIYVPESEQNDGMTRTFTFSLPEPEAFEDYPHVWLIDRALNRVTNLREANYAAALNPGTDNSRFILRIGGFPYENMYGHREYIVYSWHRDLHIRGLVEGDIIQVFSLSGQMVLNTVARDPEFTAQLPQAGGIYVVRVNDFTTKVRNL